MIGAIHAEPLWPCHHGRGPHRGAFNELFAMMGGPRGGFFPGGPGHGGPGPHGRGPRGRRARRGDIRAAALLLLAEEPRNGYALMQEIEERSEGVWRPSPGSIYPALSQLEDEGLVEATPEGSGRVFALGDSVKVEVQSVSVVRRKIDFGLAGHATLNL